MNLHGLFLLSPAGASLAERTAETPTVVGRRVADDGDLASLAERTAETPTVSTGRSSSPAVRQPAAGTLTTP